MIRLPKSLLSVGVFGLAFATLTLSLPKAAHAVAAALVQVTNTASNPAVTQDTSHLASQMVHVACFGESLHSTGGGCNLISPSATPFFPSDYAIRGTLVVTSVDVNGSDSTGASPCPSALQVNLTQYSYWDLTAGAAATAHFVYPSGFALAGLDLNGVSVIAGGSNCSAYVHIYGYLTAN